MRLRPAAEVRMSRRDSAPKKPSGAAQRATAAAAPGWLDRTGPATLLLILVAFVARLLAAWNIPALTYDGVFYLRQAERILRGTYVFESFPPGLPLPVALLGLTGMDLEFAARVINMLAGVASVAFFFALCRRHLGMRAAFLVSLLLAVHPVFVRVQVEVWSEPLYLVSLLGAILLFERGRLVWCGAVLGYAFLLRPESLVILVGLTIVWIVRQRRFPWGMLLVGLLPVIAFSILSSRELGTFVITSKQGQWDLSGAVLERIVTLFKTLHGVFPLLLVPFALVEGVRRRSILLLPVVYLAALPLYDIHIQQRLHLPAAMFLALLASMWLVRQRAALRQTLLVSSLALLVWGTAGTAKSFFEPGIMLEHSRQIGASFASHVTFDDAIAARFPFIPWYAGAGFVRLENLGYQALLDSLPAAGATHLLVLENEVVNVRPQLRELFDDVDHVRSESRLRLVAKEERFAWERALLYALQPAPIPADNPDVASGVVAATWLRDDWLGIDRAGKLVCAPGSPHEALVATWAAHSVKPLQEVAVSPDGGVAFLQADGALHLLRASPDPPGASPQWREPVWDVRDAHALAWADARHLLCLDGAGSLVSLDTTTQRTFRVSIAGIPGDLPARALATGERDGRALAITYRRPTPERPLQRAIATAVWPERIADDIDELELEVRWGTLIQLHDDRVAWVPQRDLLVVSQAVAQNPDGDMTDHVGCLSLVRPDGQTRRLSFHDPGVVAPQTTATPHASGMRLLYRSTGATLHWTTLQAADLVIPQVTVFDTPPRLRP
jgi:hypothetical protein